MMTNRRIASICFSSLLAVILACNMPSLGAPAPAPGAPPGPPQGVPPVAADTLTPAPVPTNTEAVVHLLTPSDSLSVGIFIYDVDSSGTAPEKRAPYGDSYKINRFERGFLQDMTYVPDLDIVNANLSKDTNFYYVSLLLVGTDPNNSMGINYGLEFDLNADGFGDILILAHPPYGQTWGTAGVQVLRDTNHDTGGLSGEKSDAPITTDGYDSLVFDGGQGDDPDLAWVRIKAGQYSTLQFAFKRSLPGSSFMMGAFADAGLKDPGKLDYNDRFTEAEAGSPIKDKVYYPLKALFKYDNTCREAFGFNPTGYEPQLCPKEPPPTGHPPGPTPTNTPYIIP
jgi:hypothetical protein